MVNESIGSVAAARTKALQRLGYDRVRQLPTAARIEAALIEYQAMFGGSEHPMRLGQLRQVALDAMKFFDDFEPQLVGPVASGAAVQNTRVVLHVFSDAAEDIAVHLHDHGIPYRLQDRTYRFASGVSKRCAAYSFIAGDVEVDVVVFCHKDRHSAPIDPADNQPYARTSRRELEQLLTDPAVPAPPPPG